jgi:hypothetical protein
MHYLASIQIEGWILGQAGEVNPVDGVNGDGQAVPAWTLLSSHGLVLFYVALNPDATIREMAEQLEFTERRIASIIRDLSTSNLVLVKRQGRKNYYELNRHAHFLHPVIADIPFGAFVSLGKRSKVKAEQRREAASGRRSIADSAFLMLFPSIAGLVNLPV